jgi:DNA modification methylase
MIHNGDCIEVMATFEPESIDAIVTDPPYGLGFMGKAWDNAGMLNRTAAQVNSILPAGGQAAVAWNAREFQSWCEAWAREALRVAKPGAHLLAFGGTRTYHRLAAAIEDAGWEIRDTLVWAYASGFPKSLDVSKAIDKRRDDRDDILRVTAFVRAARDAAGFSNADIDAVFGTSGMAGHWTSTASQPAVPTWEQWQLLKVTLCGFGDEMDAEVWRLNGRKGTPGEAWDQREVVGSSDHGLAPQWVADGQAGYKPSFDITAPATDLAREWQGWGTALKPAWEPIVLARKPLRGTVAGNVTEYGTGALNIDGCRIDGSERSGGGPRPTRVATGGFNMSEAGDRPEGGRWPANVILTDPIFDGDTPGVVGGGEAGGGFGIRGVAQPRPGRKNKHDDWGMTNPDFVTGQTVGYGDSGTYSRFFQLPRGESCDWCGAPPVATSSGLRSAADATAPGPVPTEPAGMQASTASEDKSPTASDTNGTETSTSPEPRPAIVSPLRQPARTAAQPTTSTDTTTTTGSRWTCGHSAEHATTGYIPQPEKPSGRGPLPVEQADYTRFLIVPKAARTDREPVLGGLPLRDASEATGMVALPDPRMDRVQERKARANVHPTVKPTDLMRHLVRLVTPPGGTVLDPFLGSGTTALAAELEGFAWVGIDREAEYCAIAEARLNGTQRGLGLAV